MFEGPADPRAGAQVSAPAVWQGMQRRLCSQGAREEEGAGCDRCGTTLAQGHRCAATARHPVHTRTTLAQGHRHAHTGQETYGHYAPGGRGRRRRQSSIRTLLASSLFSFAGRKNSEVRVKLHESEFAPVWDRLTIVLSEDQVQHLACTNLRCQGQSSG